MAERVNVLIVELNVGKHGFFRDRIAAIMPNARIETTDDPSRVEQFLRLHPGSTVFDSEDAIKLQEALSIAGLNAAINECINDVLVLRGEMGAAMRKAEDSQHRVASELAKINVVLMGVLPEAGQPRVPGLLHKIDMMDTTLKSVHDTMTRINWFVILGVGGAILAMVLK